MNRLPIVKLYFDAEAGEFDEETGKERLYFADERMSEYRSLDGRPPWIVKAFEVDAPMKEIIEKYRVSDSEAKKLYGGKNEV